MGILSTKNHDIEALRAYAIIVTIVAHFVEIVPEWISWTGFFWLGGGVDLFFAISGFLIAKSLLELAEKQDNFWRFASVFWVKRIFRLWPAALFWSTLSLAIYFIADPESLRTSKDIMFDSWLFAALNIENIYIYMCIQDTGCQPTPIWHYWSLSNEEQFYLLLTVMLFFTPSRKWLIIPCFIAAIAQVLSVRPWGTLLWFMRTDAMFFGTIIALSWHYYGARLKHFLTRIPRLSLQITTLIGLVLIIVLARNEVSIRYHGLVTISAGLVVLCTSANRSLLTKPAKLRTFFDYIGSRSYSLYLVHLPVFVFMHDLMLQKKWLDLDGGTDRIVITGLAVVITLILSEFSYSYVETPLRKIGRKWSNGLQAAKPVPTT